MIIDVSNWQPNLSFDDCLAMCVSLGLIELLIQDGEECARLTQRGVNAMLTMTVIASRIKQDAQQPH